MGIVFPPADEEEYVGIGHGVRVAKTDDAQWWRHDGPGHSTLTSRVEDPKALECESCDLRGSIDGDVFIPA